MFGAIQRSEYMTDTFAATFLKLNRKFSLTAVQLLQKNSPQHILLPVRPVGTTGMEMLFSQLLRNLFS